MPDSDCLALLANPHIRLSGSVDQAMYDRFRKQLESSPAGTIVVSITTLGGDPEVARLMGDDVRLLREQDGREIIFLGKVAVYSAGATFMAAFPVDCRFLTEATSLMIHDRQMHKTIALDGPLSSCVAVLKATLHEIEHSVMIEQRGFADIVKGSKVDFETVCERAHENWYISCHEAVELGLVHSVI
ncbi:MAG: ATP-dependent Clp protease proteolytic subunit [Idiomarina sp.]|nr:ATP-dependent Clp protease proteolytic subunit [Idiomarina sp.]